MMATCRTCLGSAADAAGGASTERKTTSSRRRSLMVISIRCLDGESCGKLKDEGQVTANCRRCRRRRERNVLSAATLTQA